MSRAAVGHRAEMASALACEGDAQRRALAGEGEGARAAFARAARHYRASWQLAPAGSYGRLVGMLKAAILAGGGEDEARYASEQLAGAPADSPTAAYAQALACLALGDDRRATRFAEAMRPGSEAFERAARAIVARAGADEDGFAHALEAIVRDFEARSDHLTGVAIADTALVLRELARRRGVEVALSSPLLPELRGPARPASGGDPQRAAGTGA
jgi:hypothetical protein